jgi:hypothetical protein
MTNMMSLMEATIKQHKVDDCYHKNEAHSSVELLGLELLVEKHDEFDFEYSNTDDLSETDSLDLSYTGNLRRGKLGGKKQHHHVRRAGLRPKTHQLIDDDCEIIEMELLDQDNSRSAEEEPTYESFGATDSLNLPWTRNLRRIAEKEDVYESDSIDLPFTRNLWSRGKLGEKKQRQKWRAGRRPKTRAAPKEAIIEDENDEGTLPAPIVSLHQLYRTVHFKLMKSVSSPAA